MNSHLRIVLTLSLIMGTWSGLLWSAPPLDFEAAPIHYSSAVPQNRITKLQTELDADKKKWQFADDFGYLLPLLKELKIPISSQMLTFAKTSMQRPLIDRQHPRALYFNDDAYVGYVQNGLIEMIISDETLGLVFYTLEQSSQKPKFHRQVARCMTCHSSTRTKNVPGLLVRSMFVDPKGMPVLSAGSFRTDHSSELSKRWGGWFVSGTHGESAHMGNFHLPSSKRPKKKVVNTMGTNIKDLSKLTEIDAYPARHSDIVALMVFEHQIDAQNFMIRTNYAWQIDQHHGEDQNANAVWKQEADQLVKHLLFVGEVKLKYPINGTSTFADQFARRGPFDAQGRSLRQFDLQQRLFAFPCSYMIYSSAFQSMPSPVRTHVYKRLHQVLAGTDTSKVYANFSTTDRQNLLSLLPETIPELKEEWE